MNKKELLLKIIEKIKDKYPEFLGIEEVINQGFVDNDLIDSIITNIDNTINITNIIFDKDEIKKIRTVLNNIKDLEKNDYENNSIELRELENLINNF